MASTSQHRGVSQSSPSGSQHRTLSQSSPSGSQHRTMSQSSPSGSQQPSVSQPSHSTGDNTSQSKKTKLPVIVQADGRVTGVYGGKWSSRVGHWIRAIVPISYASWDTVDDTFKDEVWGKLMEEFQLNVNPTMARQNIQKWFSPKLRSWKYGLRHKILKNCESEQDAILSCPTGFDPSHWEAFAIRESTQEVKDLCAKNAQNRSMNFVDHTCGRKPYSRILEELDEANPGKKHRRTDGWKYGHEHRDGTVLNNARELYEQVTSVEEEMAEESSERGGDADYDITRDPLARVFGKDKGRRTRGYSSCMSNKQVQKFAIAEALLEQESSSNSKLENELSEVKSTVGNLLAGQTRMETLMAGILENMRHNGSTNGQPCMHTTEVDSTSVRRTQQVPNLNPPSRLSSNPNVKILGRKGEHVANGYVKSDSKKCHFRDIVGDEKVVYVTNVLVGDAPVYDGPQDDIAYLRDIATGGFLIWAGGRLQYED